MKLTKQQEDALPHLMWLFDTTFARASGRSMLMAYTIIQVAKSSGRAKVVDLSVGLHFPSEYSYRNSIMLDRVRMMLDDIYRGDIETKNRFTYYRPDNELRYR